MLVGLFYLQMSGKMEKSEGIAVKGVWRSDRYHLRFVGHGPHIAYSG